MSIIKNKKKPFGEALHGLLYDMFRKIGITLTPDQLEKLRDSSDELANLIQGEAKLASIAYGQLIKKVVLEEFKKLEKDVNKVKKQKKSNVQQK